MNSNITSAMEWLAKILSVLVIPTLLWVNSLEVERAVQAKVIEELQNKVNTNTQELDNMQRMVADNAITLSKIQVTLEAMNNTLSEVRSTLREHEQAHAASLEPRRRRRRRNAQR